VYLARVTGRVVATQRHPGTEGVALQWIQPLDEEGRAMGRMLVASAAIASGPGDLVHYVDGREAALACPETFVPVDAAIIGFVESAWNGGLRLGQEPRASDPPERPAKARAKRGRR
jgi:microcompartment protein CcmK/EutM